MRLHNDKEAFKQAVRAAARFYHIDPSLVEKDYFVTLVLKELVDKMPYMVFKGGTSLSKCYKVIQRFSEDIDLTLDKQHFTQGPRVHMKSVIIGTCNRLGLKVLNESETKSRRAYNNYCVEYPKEFSNGITNPQLIIETVFIQKSYPTEVKSADSIIGEWLKEVNNFEAVEQFELFPFNVNAQSLERTFVDKVFAICDYMLDNRSERQSRHIYDLYCILPQITFNEELKTLITEVREDRKKSERNYSAKDDIKVEELLKTMIDSEFYKKDYEDNTMKLLLSEVAYEQAITVIDKIIDSKFFEN